MIRIKHFLYILLVLMVVTYLLGPKPPKPQISKDLPSISASLSNMEQYVEKMDEGLQLKEDNHSRIIWAEENKKERTAAVVLYLHGFSSSWYEGYPVNVNFAKQFGCNLFLPRLADHGIETDDALMNMTPDALWESAKEALMVARGLGRKVIIMATSTGGTLALQLAADFPEYVDGLILYSPNIQINNQAAFLLSKPWGVQIGRKVNGGRYRILAEDAGSKYCQYWDCKYRMEATVYLQQLLDVTMKKETFSSVEVPVFIGYYYKDKDNQDEIVKVSAMKKMFKQLGTTEEYKKQMAFPEAGDHVIASELKSNAYDQVLRESAKFAREVLLLK